MKKLVFLSALIGVSTAFGQNKIPSTESQIKTALYAAPEMYKDGAKVLGYNQKGELITIREGNNGLVCLADDPHSDRISVACYSDKLEAFMARGREAISEGKTEEEKRELRKKEIDSEALLMPKEPAAVYVVTAKQEDHDFESGELKNSRIRYVLYRPYMTAEETGLPTQPSLPGMPWLMDANTHRSHVMITPAADN